MPEQDRNKRPFISEWIPRQAVNGGGLDWSKVQFAPPGAARHETGVDAAGRTWVRLRVMHDKGSDHFLFRLFRRL